MGKFNHLSEANTAPHGVQRGLIALRRHTGVALRNHPHRGLRQTRLGEQGIGHDADICAKSHQGDVEFLLPGELSQ